MVDQVNSSRRGGLEEKIAESMTELRQLHLKPTLDDFQNFWRKKLEMNLLHLRQELRELKAEDRQMESGPSAGVS